MNISKLSSFLSKELKVDKKVILEALETYLEFEALEKRRAERIIVYDYKGTPSEVIYYPVSQHFGYVKRKGKYSIIHKLSGSQAILVKKKKWIKPLIDALENSGIDWNSKRPDIYSGDLTEFNELSRKIAKE